MAGFEAAHRRFLHRAAREVLREWRGYIERIVVCARGAGAGAGACESFVLEEGDGRGRLVRKEEEGGMWEGRWRCA